MRKLKPRKRKTDEFKDGGKVTGGRAKSRMDRPPTRRADGGNVSASDVAKAVAEANTRTQISPSDVDDVARRLGN